MRRAASAGRLAWTPHGTRETERADPVRGEEHTATTGTPASIARDLITWITTRD